jgi:hypothetical protein
MSRGLGDMQSDPIGLNGGLNTYAYAANSPTMLVDLRGLDPTSEPHPTLFPPLWPYRPGTDHTRDTANAIVDFVNDVGKTIWELCTGTDGDRGGPLSRSGDIYRDNNFDVGGSCGPWADECGTDDCVEQAAKPVSKPKQLSLCTRP